MLIARGLLVVAVLAISTPALAAAAGLSQHMPAWTSVARFPAFYGLTALAFMAFPNSRRRDMALGLIVLGALLEAALAITVHDFSLMTLGFDVAGVVALCPDRG